MPYDLIPAITVKLRADSVVTSLLPSGANGIVLAQNVAAGRADNSLLLPCIAIADGGSRANPLPFSSTSIHLRIYDNADPNSFTYLNIDRISDECIRVLHRTPLDTRMSYQTLLELWYDNFISPELYDDVLRLPYRYIRFRAYTVSQFHDDRGG